VESLILQVPVLPTFCRGPFVAGKSLLTVAVRLDTIPILVEVPFEHDGGHAAMLVPLVRASQQLGHGGLHGASARLRQKGCSGRSITHWY
jgi:hypothetical protein